MTDQERLEWLNGRRYGIGGSDAAKVMGLSDWGGPLDVYMRKINPADDDDQSEPAYWGTLLEEVVAKEFAKRSGLKVRRHNKMEFSQEHPCMLANVDRVVVGQNAGLECKTAHAMKGSAWAGDEVPTPYYVQVQHYCSVMNWEGCHIACLIGGQSFVHKYIPRNDDFIAQMIAAEEAFWNNHIMPRIPPAPTQHDRYILPQTGDDILTATDSDREYAAKLADVRRQIAELSEHKELLENIFKARIGECAGLAGIATYKANKDRPVTDWEAVALELGASDELIAAHTTVKPGARVFRFNFRGAA